MGAALNEAATRGDDAAATEVVLIGRRYKNIDGDVRADAPQTHVNVRGYDAAADPELDTRRFPTLRYTVPIHAGARHIDLVATPRARTRTLNTQMAPWRRRRRASP